MAKVEQPCGPPPGDEGSIALGAGGNPADVVIVQYGSVWARLSAGVWSFAKAFSSYNGIPLVGQGFPLLVAKATQTALVAASGTNLTYTVGASDGTFQVIPYLLINSGTTFNFTATFGFTDEGSSARSGIVMDFNGPGAQYATTITNTVGSIAYAGRPQTFRAKAGSTITTQTAAGGTYTNVNYNFRSWLFQIE